MPTNSPTPTWSRWRPFPNPRADESLTAPFGPGLYELRRRSDQRLILIGVGDNVATHAHTHRPSPQIQLTPHNPW